MIRLYEPAAYARDPGSFWTGTVTPPAWPCLDAPLKTDVAIIGGGFTGLNAALTLAQAGTRTALFEAEPPGWGASTRNGGFCCIGGALASGTTLARRHGAAQAALWHDTQVAAVAHVRDLLDTHGIDADTHSDGETELAHTPRAMTALREESETDPTSRLTERHDLAAQGMGGPWHGALTRATGFALNPARYHAGLAHAAADTGATLHARSPVTALSRNGTWHLTVNGQTVTADRVILATNGYSSEDLPPWLRARTLPVQSSILLTRPLTDAEAEDAGWTTAQMAYDSRRLLHYFRRLPDGRMLFGMRGGLTARPAEQAAIAKRIRKDFAAAFPAWADVEITHEWSGLVCLMASGHPFVGAVPDHPGLDAALGFHGNGVAMGSYAGHALAKALLGTPTGLPDFLAKPPARFPLGRHRRALLRPAYRIAETFDL